MNVDNDADWLPALVELSSFNGDWESYLEAVYQYFVVDFVKSMPVFCGRRLGLKRHPVEQGKEATFWHMTSEGKTEADRTPDMRRMERICWPKPVIEKAEEKQGTTRIKLWRNQRRGNESRILLWVQKENYLVVLADRGDYLLPWTAYLVERAHQKAKLLKEYEKFWKNRGN
jgi:hypothetical protein